MAAQNIVKKAISHVFHLHKLRRDLKKNYLPVSDYNVASQTSQRPETIPSGIDRK